VGKPDVNNGKGASAQFDGVCDEVLEVGKGVSAQFDGVSDDEVLEAFLTKRFKGPDQRKPDVVGLILEFHFGDDLPDPGAAAVQFDDLQGAASDRNIRPLLSAMHSSAGDRGLITSFLVTKRIQEEQVETHFEASDKIASIATVHT